MQRGAKHINPSMRGKIETIKSHIRCSVRPFDGDGYPFKQAIKELREEGLTITYSKEHCHYVKS